MITGFDGHTAVTLVEMPDVNHLLKIVAGDPNAAVDYANPDLPFAPEVVTAIETFVKVLG